MDVTAQEKCDKMTEFLMKRETDRLKNIQIKQDIKNLSSAEHEKVDYFAKTFAEKQNEIHVDILASEKVDKPQLPEHFDSIFKKILTLQKYVAASNIFLRTYDIKIYHQILDDLTSKAKALEDKLLPKKKFGFKSRNKNAKNVQPQQMKNGKDENDSAKRKTFDFSDQFCGFQNRTGETLCLDPEAMFKNDVMLQNLTKCRVKLFGCPSTLHVTNLKNCLVLCGPVSTSIFAENCSDCKFVIACQQLRLHSSQNVDIYLHVTSRAIMEDCNSICFAPYNLTYDNMEQDFIKAGLDINASNNYLAVDDFNWLTTEEKSPNWNELNESLRIRDWNEFCVESI